MVAQPSAPALIEAARALGPLVQELAGEIERGRRLPEPLVAAFREAGLFRLWIPRACGGLEVDPATFIAIVEEIARVDGGAGWNLMIGAGNAVIAGWLGDTVVGEIFGCNPDVITGGVYGPRGKAVAVEGGYRVTGRWPFGSGGQHCDWMVGGCFLYDGDSRRLGPGDVPVARIMVFPQGDYAILDTWYVSGLRGSGSHDYAVQDLFVPAERSFSFAEPPLRSEPLYRMPRFGLLAGALSAVTTGIARHAIDALVALAGAKTPTGQTNLLRERPAVQADVARAEALLRSARAFRAEIMAEMWEEARAGGQPAAEQRALLLLAATHASISAAQAVDLMYNAGGATSIYESSPLERCFRDVHTATQHWMIAPPSLELAGKALLGCDMGGAL